MTHRLVLMNTTALLPGGFRNVDVVVRAGLVEQISPCVAAEPEDVVFDFEGDWLSAGFIDMHLHGGGGADFMDGDVEAILTACRMHARFGTTTLYPTTLSATDEDLDTFFSSLEKAIREQTHAPSREKGARIGGVHVEGPWFSHVMAGAQDTRFLRTPDREQMERLLARSDRIAMVTMAPELDGAYECGSLLAARGILPAMGHSNATLAQVRDALDSGFRHMIHFYSGMSMLRREKGYRIPGMVEAGYLFDALSVEMIADGHHLPLDLLKLIHKVKGTERTVLVTDAMRAAGMPQGKYLLGSLKNGQEVTVEGGVARMPDLSGFAGSVCTMDRAVRTVVEAGISLEDALRMASSTPSKILGTERRRGTLLPGLDADLVRLDKKLNVRMTIGAGEVVYAA